MKKFRRLFFNHYGPREWFFWSLLFLGLFVGYFLLFWVTMIVIPGSGK